MELIVDGVWRNFRDKLAVGDVSTFFRGSTITTLLGSNGAGKSTLLKLIAGHLPVAAGRITLDDALVNPRRLSVRRQLMLVEPLRECDRSCVEPILQSIDEYQLDRRSLPDETANLFERLNLVGVYGQAMKELSKGQRYKIALICLFLVRPKVWILDEPFSSGLDANGLGVMQEEMRRHRDDGGIVIFSTQWPKQAAGIADRVIVLEQGRLVWDQPFEKHPAHFKDWMNSPALNAVLDQLGDTVEVSG